MMMNWKAPIIGLILAGASSAALAGFTQPQEVDVDLTNQTALGDQVTARYNADPDVYIGCGMRRTRTGGGLIVNTGFCQAKDAADELVTCFTEDSELLDAIASSSDFGFITFSWNNIPGPLPGDPPSAECRRIGFSNQSFYLPKKLDRN